MGEELIGGSAAWPDDYIVVKGWSEGTVILQDAMEEANEGDWVKAGSFAAWNRGARTGRCGCCAAHMS